MAEWKMSSWSGAAAPALVSIFILKCAGSCAWSSRLFSLSEKVLSHLNGPVCSNVDNGSFM